MDHDKSLDQISNAIHSWNCDAVPFRAVQMVVERLKVINQNFSSITAKMVEKGSEIEEMCNETARIRDEKSKEFQEWYDSANENCQHFDSMLNEIEKHSLSSEDNTSKGLYNDFENSDDYGESVEKNDFSTWIEKQRQFFKH